MFQHLRVVVVLPAYNAEATIVRTLLEIPLPLVDLCILVDDGSQDETVHTAQETARNLDIPLVIHRHPENRGYGGNQKTCYALALAHQADIVVMLHPDYQYTPMLLPAMIAMLGSQQYDVVLGSRMLGTGARKVTESPQKSAQKSAQRSNIFTYNSMPIHKYWANRFLTAVQNFLCGHNLSEYHTGYRGFTKDVLRNLPLLQNSDDFIFDNEMLTQAIAFQYRIGEISCPTKYFAEASSINFRRSVVYALGVLGVSWLYFLHRLGIHHALFQADSAQSIIHHPTPPAERA